MDMTVPLMMAIISPFLPPTKYAPPQTKLVAIEELRLRYTRFGFTFTGPSRGVP